MSRHEERPFFTQLGDFSVRDVLKYLFTLPNHYPKRWAFFRAVLTGLPPSIATYISFSYSNIDEMTKQNLLHKYAKSFSEEGYNLIFLIFALPLLISIFFEVYEYISSLVFFRKRLNENTYKMLVRSMNHIVGTKAERFSKYFNQIKSEPPRGDVIFKNITNPKDQIDTIIMEVCSVFRQITNDDDLNVVLVSVENSVANNYIRCMPADRPPSLDLAEENNFFNYIVKNKKKDAIKDIAKTIKSNRKKKKMSVDSFVYGESSSIAEGSIIGIPVFSYDQKKVKYVLTIKSKKTSLFTRNFISKYEHIIDTYISRLSMEATLVELRRVAS